MLYVTHKRKTTQKAIILWCFLCKWVRKTKPFFLWKTFIFVENCFPPAYKITFRQVFLKKRQWGGGQVYGKYNYMILARKLTTIHVIMPVFCFSAAWTKQVTQRSKELSIWSVYPQFIFYFIRVLPIYWLLQRWPRSRFGTIISTSNV